MLNIFNNISQLEYKCFDDEDLGEEDITQINLPYLTELNLTYFSSIHKMIRPSKIIKITLNSFKYETMKLHVCSFFNLRRLEINVIDEFDC